MNWPKSIKCVQCLTPRHCTTNHQSSVSSDECLTSASLQSKSTSSISSSKELNCKQQTQSDSSHLIELNNNLNAINSVNSNLSDLSDKEIDSESHFIKPSTSTDKRESTYDQVDKSPNSPPSADSLNNSLNSSLNSLNNDQPANDSTKLIDNLQTSLNKWRCTSCTYLNWPKSLKCILCQTPKSLTSAINSTTTTPTNCSTATESINCSASNGRQSSTITIDDKRSTPSPTSVTGATCQRNRLNSNLNNVNTIINYNLNCTINRRKTREQYNDWLWLDACIGVLNGRSFCSAFLIYYY